MNTVHMNATLDPPLYSYVMAQKASNDVPIMETLLHLRQQQLVYGQGAFPYTAYSSHEEYSAFSPRVDPFAAQLAPLISLASQVSSKATAMELWPSMLATPTPTPFDDETIARALSLITSASGPLSTLDNGNDPNVLSQQFQLLMILSELQRQQQQQRRAAQVNAVLQNQRQELCRASMGLPQYATSTQVAHYSDLRHDMPPVLVRQSPEKPSALKKRHHYHKSPCAKRFRTSLASPMQGIYSGNGVEAIVKGTMSPSTSPGGPAILQQLIDEDEVLDKQAATAGTVASDSPHRHHPNYLPKRDPEAALLEDYATVYMLNGLGGLCGNQLEKSLEEALSDMPFDSSSPSSNENFPNLCSTDSAYASLIRSRASINSDSNESIDVL